MEPGDDIFQFVMDALIRTFHIIYGFLRKERACDVSAWAIAFTMNTWGASLVRARFQMYGTIRKAIDSSHAKAQQAHFLERLMERRQSVQTDRNKVEKFKKLFFAFLTKLEKLDRKYPPIQTENHNEMISIGTSRFLGFCAFFSVLCILFGWFYNATLVVLFPYPIFALLYAFKKWRLPRFIQNSYEKSENAFNLAINEDPAKEEISLDDLAKKLSTLCGGLSNGCGASSQVTGDHGPSKNTPKKVKRKSRKKKGATESMSDSW